MKATPTKFIDKMKEVEQSLTKEYGNFALFALLEREDSPDRWDVVVASAWLGTGSNAIFTLAREFVERLTPEDAVRVARIVPLDLESDFVKFLQDTYAEMSVTGPVVRLGESVLSGIDIRSGYILEAGATTSRVPSNSKFQRVPVNA